jgi:hypothetical protein
MDEKSRKKKRKIKFWSTWLLARSCHIYTRSCMGRPCLKSANIHARLCALIARSCTPSAVWKIAFWNMARPCAHLGRSRALCSQFLSLKTLGIGPLKPCNSWLMFGLWFQAINKAYMRRTNHLGSLWTCYTFAIKILF